MVKSLQRGQISRTGNVVSPHCVHRLPTRWGSSCCAVGTCTSRGSKTSTLRPSTYYEPDTRASPTAANMAEMKHRGEEVSSPLGRGPTKLPEAGDERTCRFRGSGANFRQQILIEVVRVLQGRRPDAVGRERNQGAMRTCRQSPAIPPRFRSGRAPRARRPLRAAMETPLPRCVPSGGRMRSSRSREPDARSARRGALSCRPC